MRVHQLIEVLKRANPLAVVVLQDEFDDNPMEAGLVVQDGTHDFVSIRQGRKPKEYEVDWDGEEYLYKESK